MNLPTKISLVCLLLTAALLNAQSTADIRGTVTDSSHKPIVSAFVIISANNGAFMRAETTDDSGDFIFTGVPVGTYDLEVKVDGERVYSATNIRASIGEVVRLSILSGSSASASSGTVAQPSMIEASKAQLGVVMDSLDATALPLKSRDTFELLQLQPGVQSTTGVDLFFGSDRPGVISVDGGRARSNQYNVNGGNAGDQMVNSPSIQPAPDLVSEFRVLSHNYDASLGRNSGSAVNVITKSGSSQFHGALYEYLRNQALNAKGYFDATRPDFKQNDFGANFGGPLQRDKTFFFASYEGRRLRRGITSQPVTVPTSAERSGDFSSGDPFTGTLQSATVAQVLDNRPGCSAAAQARGGAPLAAETPYAEVFPGNVIPSACFDATAVDLMNQFVPAANSAGDTFLSAPLESTRNDQLTLRLDRTLTSQQRLSFFYYGGDAYDLQPFSQFQGSGSNVPGFGQRTRERFQQLNLSHNWTITAKAVNEARFVYYHNGQGQLGSPQRTNLVQDSCSRVSSAQCFNDPSNPGLGIRPGLGSSLEGVPFVSVADAFSYGNNPNSNFSQRGEVYSFNDTYTHSFSNHTLSIGGDFRNLRMTQLYAYEVNGNFGFTDSSPNTVGFGTEMPDYMLGLPSSYAQGSANAVDARSLQLHWFAQDSWKARSNLVLEYGLRWELNTPWADASNRVQEFQPGRATTVYPCVLAANDPLALTLGSTDCSPTSPASSVFPLGLVFPGDKGINNALTHTYLRSFAPRLGFAWSPNFSEGLLSRLTGGPGRTSIRAGWGIFYDSNEELVFGGNLAGQPPFGGSTILSNTFFNTPFLGQDGSVLPNPFTGVLNPKPGTPVDFALFRPITLYASFPETMRSQYSIHYHLTVQRELGRDLLLQVGYVGTQGHRLLASIDQNYGNAQTCLDLNQIPGMACGPFGADSSYTIPANAIPSGVTLHLPYGSAPSVTGPNPNPITLVGLRRYSSPLCEPTTGVGCPADGVPVFGSLFGIEPIGNSSYNSLQTLLNKRLGHGLQFIAAYTWSKMIDNGSSFEELINPIDPRSSRSLSLFDARHRFTFSGVWQLPELHTSSWTRHLFNGWSTSGIVTFQSGFPIRLASFDDFELMSSFDYSSVGRPDQVAPFKVLDPRKSGGYYFDPASFADASLGQAGNAPRTICCGPGIQNIDFALMKTLKMTESSSMQFRSEFFNLFNHTQFLNPEGNITLGSSFGQVSQARDPRLMQIAVRLTF